MSSLFARASGLLLHVTSLPARTFAASVDHLPGTDGEWSLGDLGSGDLGPSAYEFIRFLKACGQRWWQILPTSPTGYGFSPYQSPSSFAGNPLLISPALLARDGLLRIEDWHDAAKPHSNDVRGNSTQSHFELSASKRMELLRMAFRRFQNQRSELHSRFEEYRHLQASWLSDHCLFVACKNYHNERAWNEWDPNLVRRETHALANWSDKLRVACDFEAFIQFLFDRQWQSLRQYAISNDVGIIGDIPIFVAMDSSDVWSNQHLFELNEQGNPTVVAGVPPDYFAELGQRWGNPLYRWEAHHRSGYDWWIRRFRRSQELCDLIRIDHFRGFEAYWEIPSDLPDARVGQWRAGPRSDFFDALQGSIQGQLPVIAEDLGFITQEVRELRDRYHFPGMRVIQFGFGGGDSSSLDLPHNYPVHCIAYTGTHDNDTLVGWFHSKPGAGSTRSQAEINREKSFALRYLNCDPSQIHTGAMRAIWSSVACIAIAPVQDLLGLDSDSRMNTPGLATGNWTWRCDSNLLQPNICNFLQEITEVFGRSNGIT
ncbi:MAG: 4-alpha-glucanotransferase [Pirellula sp.]